MVTLAVGAPFIAISGTTHDEERVNLANLKGKKNAVVYFYPKDNTPGCTREGRDFSAMIEQFSAADTAVIGVSVDSLHSHSGFCEKYNLRFPLLSDEGGRWGRQLGIMRPSGKHERTTFLIDREGIVQRIWEKVSVTGHASAVLKAAQALN